MHWAPHPHAANLQDWRPVQISGTFQKHFIIFHISWNSNGLLTRAQTTSSTAMSLARMDGNQWTMPGVHTFCSAILAVV